jgi:lauroyl/myristoyl acyltransferase
MKDSKNELHNNEVKLELSMLSPSYLLTWLGTGFLYVLTLLPIKIQLFLGGQLGSILLFISPQRKNITQINLQLCFPEKTQIELEKMVKEVFKDIGKGLIETGIAWWKSDRFIDKLITKKTDFEHLDSNNEGCLILLKHSTHAELDIRIISRLLRVGGMYKTQTNKVMNYLMIKARNKYLIGTVTNRQTRRGLKWLRNGLKFLYAADQDYGTKGSEFVPFFGIQAATITLPSDLFKKGTRVYFFNVIRVNSSYEITLSEFSQQTDKDGFLNEMNNFYQKAILETPTQYFWMHRRFKTRPEGEEGFYPHWKRREARRERERNKKVKSPNP